MSFDGETLNCCNHYVIYEVLFFPVLRIDHAVGGYSFTIYLYGNIYLFLQIFNDAFFLLLLVVIPLRSISSTLWLTHLCGTLKLNNNIESITTYKRFIVDVHEN